MTTDERAVADAQPQSRHPHRPSAASRHRPEIQGLRAVAVLLVVGYHLWPNRLTGGYVGVDVFFVISGFLITGHIHRELVQTGGLRLGRFWARRVRRLLPASLLVLLLSAAGVLLVAPATVWTQSARQIAASALYVQNWVLAFDAVDYMAADNVPTVAQHYWSLSVEEQFYVLWPLLVLGLAVLARQGRQGRRAAGARVDRLLAPGLAVLAAASLGWSVVSTARDQSFAYMSTFTRVWEFAAGALLAVLAVDSARSRAWRVLLGWAGAAAVVVAGATFDDDSAFPGSIALLPVLGTVAVILAGRGGPGTAGWWLSLPPARFIGDISYSVYLWHWPLVVLVPYATGHPLRLQDKAVVLVATILLAWASKTFVEDPLRVRPLLAAAPWRAFAFAAAGMLVTVTASTAITAELARQEREAAARAVAVRAQEAACLGPGAMDNAAACGGVMGDGDWLVPPAVVVRENTDPPYRGCQQTRDGTDVRRCELGETEDPGRTIALVGDSHATQWFPAFELLGQQEDWKVVTMAKASCPLSMARRVLDSEQTDTEQVSCDRWVDNVLDSLTTDPEISTVVVASYSTAYEWQSRPDDVLTDPGPDGFAQAWSALVDAGKEVAVLAAVPRTRGENVPNCLAAHPDDPAACAVPREAALPGDVMLEAAGALADPAVSVVDLSDRFCDEDTCYPVVGDVIVYRDYSHLSADYSTLLVPYLTEALAP